MASRPATPIESLLGVEKAASCEEEIRVRSHPDDTPEFRKQLVEEVLRRHIHKANLRLNDIAHFIGSDDPNGQINIRNLGAILVDKIYKSNKEGYQVDKNQRSR